MDDDAPTGTDNVITEFENYEQFLDSQITALDLFYLEVRIKLPIVITSSTTTNYTNQLFSLD